MADEVIKENIVEDIADLSLEEKAEAWQKWVRNEVNAALDIYLPIAKSGHINVKYSPVVTQVLESGPVFEEDKVSAVLLSIVFEFENTLDLSKPMEDNTDEQE